MRGGLQDAGVRTRLEVVKETRGIEMSGCGFPTFRCRQAVTGEDVKALEDEELAGVRNALCADLRRRAQGADPGKPIHAQDAILEGLSK